MPRVRRKPQGFGRNQRVRQRMAPQPDRNFPGPERPQARMYSEARRRVQRGGSAWSPSQSPPSLTGRPGGQLPPGRGPTFGPGIVQGPRPVPLPGLPDRPVPQPSRDATNFGPGNLPKTPADWDAFNATRPSNVQPRAGISAAQGRTNWDPYNAMVNGQYNPMNVTSEYARANPNSPEAMVWLIKHAQEQGEHFADGADYYVDPMHRSWKIDETGRPVMVAEPGEAAPTTREQAWYNNRPAIPQFANPSPPQPTRPRVPSGPLMPPGFSPAQPNYSNIPPGFSDRQFDYSQPPPNPPDPPFQMPPGPTVPPQVPPGQQGPDYSQPPPGFQMPAPQPQNLGAQYRAFAQQQPLTQQYQAAAQNAPSLPSMAPQSPQMASNVRSGLQGLGQQPQQPPQAAPPPPSGLQGQPPVQGNPAGGLQGQPPAPQPAPWPGGQGVPPGPVNDQNPGPDANSLFLNPQYEAGVRALDDELSATLAQIGVSRQEAQGINKLIKERLGIERGEDLSATDEAANARGLFDSGIRTTNRNRVERGYRQNFEDIDLDFARTLRDLASGEIGARSGYSKGLAELLMGVANQMAGENNSPIGMSTREPRKPPPKKKRRRRRKRR